MMEERRNTKNNSWTFNISEIGPINKLEPYKMKIVKQILHDIPSNLVTENWWSDMSEGRLAIDNRLELLKNTFSYVDWIDPFGNIQITIEEVSPTLFQQFTISADRKQLKRLEEIAAYNVARLITDKSDLENFLLPRTLKRLVAPFLDILDILKLFVVFVVIK